MRILCKVGVCFPMHQVEICSLPVAKQRDALSCRTDSLVACSCQQSLGRCSEPQLQPFPLWLLKLFLNIFFSPFESCGWEGGDGCKLLTSCSPNQQRYSTECVVHLPFLRSPSKPHQSSLSLYTSECEEWRKSEKVRLTHTGRWGHARTFQLAMVMFIPVHLPAV